MNSDPVAASPDADPVDQLTAESLAADLAPVAAAQARAEVSRLAGTPGAPIGPASLYWSCWLEGRDALQAGASIFACPYSDTGDDPRPYSGRAWRDGWYAAARRIGVRLPSDDAENVDETTPAPRGSGGVGE